MRQLIFLMTALHFNLAYGESNYLKEATEMANAQKSPYKEMLLENIKKFQEKDSDGGQSLTKDELGTIKQFIDSFSKIQGKSKGEAPKADVAKDSSSLKIEINEIQSILATKLENTAESMSDAIKCYTYASFLHKHSNNYSFGKRNLQNGSQSELIKYTTGLDLPKLDLYTDNAIELVHTMIQKCRFILDSWNSACSVPCFEPNRLSIMTKVIQKTGKNEYLVTRVEPNKIGTKVMNLATGAQYLIKSTTELGRGTTILNLLHTGFASPTMADGFEKSMRSGFNIEPGSVSALMCRMQQLKDALNSRFPKDKFQCGYGHAEAELYDSPTATMVCSSKSGLEDGKLKASKAYFFPFEYKDCKSK